MARRSSPPEPEDRVLSVPQMQSGIQRLKRRIDELERFDPQQGGAAAA
jgi:hypothetical protein